VAFAGTDGGAAHSAARFRFGLAAELVRSDATSDAFEQVSRQRAEFAVVPMETRAGGSVQSTITMLAASELKLCACFEVAENLVLAGREGTSLQTASGVLYASAQDHALCERFLARELPGVRVVDARTPLAALDQALAEGAFVLAQETFAAERGLTVLSRNVRDDGGDRVRYAVVGARPPPRTGNDRTGIAFSVADSPGALHEILARFADRGINLSKIQSQPVPGDDWKYLFYVEAEGHATDRSLVAALEEVKRVAKFIRVLGSYEL
jgi:chorismate mutase/prephenate dehydratase